MIHIKYKLNKSNLHGIGLFTDEDLEKGQIVYSSSPSLDLNLTENQFNSLKEEEKKEIKHWGFYNVKRKIWHVDFDVSKFINHSNQGNLTLDKNQADTTLVAIRNIAKDEELTQNYLEFEEQDNLKQRNLI